MELRTRTSTALLAAIALAAAAVSGCSTKSDDGDSASPGAAGTVKTGPGISGTTIKLGILTDLSSVFASQGKDLSNAAALFWEQHNAKGGVCGRYTVSLDVRDTNYNVQQAVQLYSGLRGDVLAIQQTLGSPINTAIEPQLTADKMVNIPAAWARNLTVNPQNAVVGSTYDVEMINGISYLLENGLLRDGDTVGHIYFEGEFGANGLAGSKYMAGEHGLRLIESKIKATDADMTAQVTQFRAAGVKAILLSAAPGQTTSVASVASSQQLNVPIFGNSPVFAPGVLGGPAAPALKANLYVGAPYAAFDKAPQLLADYSAKHPDIRNPSLNVVWGFAAADVMRQILDRACENGDLTREGVSAAKSQLTSVQAVGGLVPPLDFSTVGESPSTKTYIMRAVDAPGGLRTVSDQYESTDLGGFRPGE